MASRSCGQSEGSRARWTVSEKVKSVASKACWKFQEKTQIGSKSVSKIPRASSEPSIKSLLECSRRRFKASHQERFRNFKSKGRA